MMREDDRIPKEVKEKDMLYSFKLFIATVIPFLVNFPELVLEVAKHIDFIKRVITYSKGKKKVLRKLWFS